MSDAATLRDVARIMTAAGDQLSRAQRKQKRSYDNVLQARGLLSKEMNDDQVNELFGIFLRTASPARTPARAPKPACVCVYTCSALPWRAAG